MSELISVGILAGLALWGYGCCRVGQNRATKIAGEKTVPLKALRRASAARSILICLLMLLSTEARAVFAQTAASSVFPANPTYVDAVTGIVTIPAVSGQPPVTGMIDYTIDGGPVVTATVSTGNNYVNLGQLSIGSHVLTFQSHPGSPAASPIVPPPPVSIPVADQSFGFVGVYGRFHSNYTDANLFSSAGLAIDSKDTVWIADSILSKLVSFDVFGNINNIAIASLPLPIANPAGLAFDSSDNLFIADRGNSRIVKYTPAGVETVLPTPGLGRPGQLMLDKVRNLLYIVDQDNERVVRYDLSAMALAGYPFSGLTAIQSIALDPAGNVYVSDNVARFLKNVSGVVSALPVSAPIAEAGGIFVDRAGLLYLTDSSINATYRIDAQGHQTQISDYDSSHALAEDSRGQIYFGTGPNVRTFMPAGEVGTVTATTSIFSTSDAYNSLVYTMPQGQTALTRVLSPSSNFASVPDSEACPYVERFGTCYFSVHFSSATPGTRTGTVATTLPGGPTITTLLYGNAVGAAPAFSPGTQTQTPSGAVLSEGVALDQAGNYYVSDASTNQILETSGGVTVPLGFTGLLRPTNLAVDGAGAVYVLDSGNNRIAKLDLAGNQTYPVVAGTGNPLQTINAFALDGGGQIYFAGGDPNGGLESLYLYDRTGATSLIASNALGYTALALDPYGDIYALMADSSLIRIDNNGKQSTLAPKGTIGSSNTVADALAVDASETAYVAVFGSPAITLVHPGGNTESIPVPGFSQAAGIAIDGTGSILAVDSVTNNFIFVDRTHQDFNFGDVPVNTTTTFSAFFGNAGSEAFQITGLPGDSDFQQVTTADACSTSGTNSTIAAASSCDLSYTVAPTTLGTITAYGRVTTTASVDFDTFTEIVVNAPVLSLTPASFDFGIVPSGKTPFTTLTLSNTGSTPASVDISLFEKVSNDPNNPSSSFAETSACPATLAPGASCGIVVTFNPVPGNQNTATVSVSAPGAASVSATFTGTGAAPVLSLTPSSYDFGSVASGATPSTTLTLKNSGNAPAAVNISLLAKVSNDPSNPLSSFSETSNCPASLAPGASCGIIITFTPVAGSPGTATVSVSAAGAATLSSTLTGTGAPGTPVFSLTPATYAFGNVQPGSTPTTTLTLKNTGTANAALLISLIEKVSNDPNNPLSSFGETSNCPASLAPGASCGIVVTFTPVPGNQNSATVSVTAAGAASVSATLTGTGAAPVLTLTPASYSFGTVTPGKTPSMTLTLANSGNAPAAVTVSLFERNSNDPNNPSSSFTETSNCPTSLAAGASCAIVVTFDPVAGGQGSANLSVNAPGAATVSSTLTGTGAPAVTAIDFGTGFSTSALTLNGTAAITGGALQLTSGPSAAASSAFFPNPAVTTTFATDFTFQLLDPATEGITFTIQGDGPAAVGSNGGGLGYQGIPKSIALKFDLRDTAGEGDDSTGIYVNGAAPTVPATSLASSGIDLDSGDVFALHIAYDGTTEFISLTDTVTNAVWTTQAAENIPSIVGGNSAYFGFTAGTGAVSADAVPAKSQTAASTKPMDAAATAASTTAASVISWTYNTVITPATLTPTALNFGNVTVGSTSGVQTAELTNTGTAQFQVASITQSDPAIVVHSSYCARPVTPGTYCKLEVTLAPSAAGPFSGTVVINYYLGDGSLPGENLTSTLTVTGTGVVPSVTLTPASADFGSVIGSATSSPKTFTVTNNSASAVTLTQVTIAEDATLPFQTASGATCISGGQLAAGKSCTIPVVFAPTTTGGATSGTLYVSYLDTSDRAVTLASVLTGSVPATLTPASYDFGSVTATTGLPTGSLPRFGFTMTNTSTVPISVTNIIVTGSGFSESGLTCFFAIAPGGSCQVDVQFEPTLVGAATGTLSVVTTAGTLTSTLTGTGTAPTATLTPTSHDFGSVTVGSDLNSTPMFRFTVTNTSTIPIKVTNNAVTGSGFSSFIQTCFASVTIAPGGSCIIDVLFEPTVAGAATGTLSVVTSAGTLTSTFTGTGTAPIATLTPTSHDFGSVTVGSDLNSTPMFRFTVTNTSTIPIKVTSNTVTGSGFSSFIQTCFASVTIAPGGSCIIDVLFEPTVAGAATGTLSVVTSAGTLTSTFTGTGIAPSATLTPTSHDFGIVTVGSDLNSTPMFRFTVTNTSTISIKVTSNIVTGSGFSSFIQTCFGSVSIAPGGSCIIDVLFEPTVAGAATGTLSVVTSAGTLTSTLTGTGVAPPVTTPFINFGTGFTADALTLTGPVNVAGGALQLTAGPSSAASSAFYPTPVPTASFTTDFTFQLLDPTAEGITFTIQGDGPNAAGAGGGGLGYQGLAKSIAVKFDLKDTAGEGVDSTGIYVNGAAPTVPAVSLASSGIDLHSGDTFDLRLTYDGTTMTVNLTDTVTNATWSTQAAEDIPGITGGSTAYFGFTAGSGTPTLTSDAAEAKTALMARPAAVAVDATPVSATSNILSWIYVANGETKAAQSISFPALAAKTYGAAPITLAAKASSGLPVSYAVTGPANLSGSSLTITGAGTVTVTASQAGNASFAAASSVSKSFAVTKAPLTVTANSVSRAFGAANPAFSYQVSGFVEGDTVAVVSGTATLTTAATTASAPGTYKITFASEGLTAANYSFTYLAGTLTVTPRTLVIAPASGNFGSVEVGKTSSAISFTVTNGTASTMGYLGFTNLGEFYLQPGTCHLVNGEPMLNPGQSCVFTAVFKPTKPGAVSGNLSIQTSSGTFNVPMTGTGTTLVISPASGNFGSIAVGKTSAAISFTVTNDTASTMGYLGYANLGEFYLQPGTCRLVNGEPMLNPGQSCIFTAVFRPTKAGAVSGNLSIQTSSGTFNVPMTGTGVTQ